MGNIKYKLASRKLTKRQVEAIQTCLPLLLSTPQSGLCYVISMLQCVAVCGSVLQCVVVCGSVLQCVAVCCSVWQCVAVCCSVLQCVDMCCNVLQ